MTQKTSFQQLFSNDKPTTIVENDVLQRIALQRLQDRRKEFDDRAARIIEKAESAYARQVDSLRTARDREKSARKNLTKWNRALAFLESTGNMLPMLYLTNPLAAEDLCRRCDIEIDNNTFEVPDDFEMPKNWSPSVKV